MLKEKVISRKRKEERKGGREKEEGGRDEGREEGRKRRKNQPNILEINLVCNSDFLSNQQTVESLNVFLKYNNSNNTEERNSIAPF